MAGGEEPRPKRRWPITMQRSPAIGKRPSTHLDKWKTISPRCASSNAKQQQQQRAVASAREALQLFTNRYKGGVDTYLQVITAQTVTLLNERNQVDIMRRRMDASVLLVKALGGGWNVTDLPQF